MNLLREYIREMLTEASTEEKTGSIEDMLNNEKEVTKLTNIFWGSGAQGLQLAEMVGATDKDGKPLSEIFETIIHGAIQLIEDVEKYGEEFKKTPAKNFTAKDAEMQLETTQRHLQDEIAMTGLYPTISDELHDHLVHVATKALWSIVPHPWGHHTAFGDQGARSLAWLKKWAGMG